MAANRRVEERYREKLALRLPFRRKRCLGRTFRSEDYRAGHNLMIERRGAMGRTADLPRLAEELVAARVEALVTIGYPPAVAAKAAGIPTVAASGVGDPVATGLRTTSLPPGYMQ